MLIIRHSPLAPHPSLLAPHPSPLTAHCPPQSVGSELASLVSTALGVESPSHAKRKSTLGVVSPVSVPARTGTGTVEEEARGDEAQGVHLDAISPKRCCRPGAQPHLQRACSLQRASNLPACTCLYPPHTASGATGSQTTHATRRAKHTFLHRRRRAASRTQTQTQSQTQCSE